MNHTTDGRMVASPCISVCVMDPASGLCAGCYRTLDEIADWSNLSNEGRRVVIALLAERRDRHGVLPGLSNGAHAER
ncbi:MAG: DUF1289 domain-containing protein [Casimicrobiaceae bacterium]